MLTLLTAAGAYAQRTTLLMDKGWKFSKGDFAGAEAPDFDDSSWDDVTIPHDWAITGPFDRNIDIQTVAIKQDLEKVATVKTGRTGGLPYIGTGWYRNVFSVPEGKKAVLLFDGAMSEARVFVNGTEDGCREAW